MYICNIYNTAVCCSKRLGEEGWMVYVSCFTKCSSWYTFGPEFLKSPHVLSLSLSLSLKSVLLNHCTKWAASFGEDRGKKIIGNDVSPSLLLSCLIFISLSVSCSCSRSFSLCLVSNSLLLSLTKVFFHLRLQEANNKTQKYFSTANRGDSVLHMVSKSLNWYFILFQLWIMTKV